MKNDRAKYLIIGNSTAAVGGVEGIRRREADTPIVLISREPHHTYSRPLISYLLAGDVDEQQMYFRSRDFYDRNCVDARLGVEAVGIDIERRVVDTQEGGQIPFEKLLIATGGRPFMPDINGLTDASPDDATAAPTAGVFTLTSWDDAKAIGRYIEKLGPRKAVVVGGGLIGIKAAEALRARGLDVLVVELAEHLLPVMLDETGSELAVGAVRDAGLEVECGTTVQNIVAENGVVSGVTLSSGREVGCEMVIIAVGVVPDVRLVSGSAIKTDRGILIDEHCETSADGIYAAGDVAQGTDALTGRSRPIPIFPQAYRQGWVAGANMADGNARVDAAFGMNSMEIFGLPIISVGLATASGDEYDILSQCDPAARTYRRVVLKDGRVVGAVFVGDIDRAGILTGLIRGRVDVSGIRNLLLSDQLGLISLPAEYRKHVVKGEGIEV